MRMKKFLSIFMSLVMLAGITEGLDLNVRAQTYSGMCGDNAYWSYDSATSTVTISGSGDMYNDRTVIDEDGTTYRHRWRDYSYNNVIIEDGITYISYGAFANAKITEVTIPASVTAIGGQAFYYCSNLASVYFIGDKCAIADSEETFCNTDISNKYITFYCNKDSDAHKFAQTHGMDFQIPYSQCNHIAYYDSTAGAYYCRNCGSYLFMENDGSYQCTVHDFKVTSVSEPTCTMDGCTTYSCTVCGYTYSEIVSAIGHNYTATVTAPTCTEQGYTTYTCTRCGYSIASDYTAATGHTVVTVPAVAPTCTQNGFTAGRRCSVCGKVLMAQEVVSATGHSYTAVVTAPTCTFQGYTTYTCTSCGNIHLGDYTSATGHSYGTDGKAQYCTVCGTANPNYVTPSTEPTTEKTTTQTAPTAITTTIPTSKKTTTSKKITTTTAQSDNGKSANAQENTQIEPSVVVAENGTTFKFSVSKPKKTSVSKLTKGKKQFKVTWKKVSGVTGYQLQYSTDKKFKKNKKTVTVRGAKNTSKTVKNLKSKKTYYVRVRVYNYVKVNGIATKAYSDWSKAKSVKTK